MSAVKIQVYDTTLRDGAQAEGVSFSGAAKLRLARCLDEFGVDYIEGGYAGSNEKDMEFFREVQRLKLGHARMAAFGSTRRKGMRAASDPFTRALLAAGTPVCTIFGKSSLLHVRDVLRTTPEENLDMIYDTVAHLKKHGREVVYDAEHFFDGYAESAAYALQALEAAQAAGADWLVLCDTNGGSLPHVVHDVTRLVKARFRVPVGIHCHNDGGTGVANSVEAVRAGATQVQGTINGYGERCGNANLVTVIPTLQLKLGCRCVTPAQLRRLREVSVFTDELVGFRHDSKAPYVGHSAFSHKAGAHVNAVRKNPKTFEHVPPESVGNERHILVSELSGSSNVLLKAIELGAGREKLEQGAGDVLKALKELESAGYAYEAADGSFYLLVQKVLKEHKSFFELEGFRVIVEKRGRGERCLSEATVKLRVNGELEHTVGEGDGPVNALDNALRKALTRFYPAIAGVFLTDFQVRILDPKEATAAKTRVLIESSDGRETWGTVGVSENIIEASWEALVDGVEYRLFKDKERRGAKVRKGRTRAARKG